MIICKKSLFGIFYVEILVSIVRRFEVAENVFTGTALNVSQLRALFAVEQAVPFHERFFPLGHNLGNVTDWFDWSLTNGDGEENDEIKSRPFPYRWDRF